MDRSTLRPVRVEYTRRERDGTNTRVIYEVDAAGHESFFESSYGELRWSPFAPSDAERQAARRLRDQGGGEGFIDLNRLPAP